MKRQWIIITLLVLGLLELARGGTSLAQHAPALPAAGQAALAASAPGGSAPLACGTATFGPVTDFGAGASPIDVAVGDFNRDGRLDLVTANSGSANVSVLLGTGAGGFGAATNFPVGTNPSAVAVGDFNRDGY